MTRFFCGNCRQEIVGSLPCLHCYLKPVVLTMLPAEPKAPTRMELEDAILAFADELCYFGEAYQDDQITQSDRVLLGLAERLAGSTTHQEAISRPVTAGMAPDTGSAIPETPYGPSRGEAWWERDAARAALRRINDWATMDPAAEPFGWIADETAAALGGQPDPLHAALRRWIVAREEWAALTREHTSLEAIRRVDELHAATEALEALARSVLGDGE